MRLLHHGLDVSVLLPAQAASANENSCRLDARAQGQNEPYQSRAIDHIRDYTQTLCKGHVVRKRNGKGYRTGRSVLGKQNCGKEVHGRTFWAAERLRTSTILADLRDPRRSKYPLLRDSTSNSHTLFQVFGTRVLKYRLLGPSKNMLDRQSG